MNQQQNQGQEIDGQQFRCGARLRFGPSRKDQSEMEQQAGHQQTRHDFGPINLPVESVQFSAEVERPKAERSQAKNVEVHGPGSIPPADENEQADEQVKQADNAKVIFNGQGLNSRSGHQGRFKLFPIAGELVVDNGPEAGAI